MHEQQLTINFYEGLPMVDIQLEIAEARAAVTKRQATDTQIALVALANEMGAVVSRLQNQGVSLARVTNELDEMVSAIVHDQEPLL